MPLFGKRKREEDLQLQRTMEAVRILQSVMRVRDAGGLDIATLGGIDERSVIETLTDFYRLWDEVFGFAWQSYNNLGRGYIVMDGESRQWVYNSLREYELPHPSLPGELASYCKRYDPRTEMVIVIEGFPDRGLPHASAAAWARPATHHPSSR